MCPSVTRCKISPKIKKGRPRIGKHTIQIQMGSSLITIRVGGDGVPMATTQLSNPDPRHIYLTIPQMPNCFPNDAGSNGTVYGIHLIVLAQ